MRRGKRSISLSQIIARKPDAGRVLTKAVLRAADRLGLSGRQLANIVGVSEATVSRWERGESLLEPGSTIKAIPACSPSGAHLPLARRDHRRRRSCGAALVGRPQNCAAGASRGADDTSSGACRCHDLSGRKTRSALKSGPTWAPPGASFRHSTGSRPSNWSTILQNKLPLRRSSRQPSRLCPRNVAP